MKVSLNCLETTFIKIYHFTSSGSLKLEKPTNDIHNAATQLNKNMDNRVIFICNELIKFNVASITVSCDTIINFITKSLNMEESVFHFDPFKCLINNFIDL